MSEHTAEKRILRRQAWYEKRLAKAVSRLEKRIRYLNRLIDGLHKLAVSLHRMGDQAAAFTTGNGSTKAKGRPFRAIADAAHNSANKAETIVQAFRVGMRQLDQAA